jgi:hypothetical protein
MPFIGNQPALSYTSFAKQDFTTSATTSYALSQPVTNENEIALFINFVRQEPTTAYTASGTSLTLTSATSASDDMYAIFLGKAVQTVNPPAGSVGISQLSATGTKDATTFLRGDNTFAAVVSGLTEAQQWRLTADLVGDANPISSNLEIVDTGGYGGIGSGMTESSGIFTFPSTGIYLIDFNAIQQCMGTADYANTYIQTTTDNSSYYDSASGYFAAASSGTAFQSGITNFIFDVTNTSTHKVRFRIRQATTSNKLRGSSSYNYTTMTFIKLGDT